MSAEEKAEIVFIVLKRLMKWCLFGLLVLAALFGTLIGYQSFTEYYQTGRHEKKVKIGIAIKTTCPNKMPLGVEVFNGSKKVIRRIDFNVDVTKAGYSTTLNDLQSYQIDKIMKPGESISYCFEVLSKNYLPNSYERAKLTGDGLEARLSWKSVRFQKEN
jgi:hypothetical protein